MKRTQGSVDGEAQQRRAALEAIAGRPLAQVAIVPDLKALLKALLDYLGIPYREA